jgi:hypothetical protein
VTTEIAVYHPELKIHLTVGMRMLLNRRIAYVENTPGYRDGPDPEVVIARFRPYENKLGWVVYFSYAEPNGIPREARLLGGIDPTWFIAQAPVPGMVHYAD